MILVAREQSPPAIAHLLSAANIVRISLIKIVRIKIYGACRRATP